MSTPITELTPSKSLARIEQNGVRQPKAGTLVRKIWDACDALTAQKGTTVPRAEVVSHFGDTMKWNTVSTQYAYWRRFNGIGGRVYANTPDDGTPQAPLVSNEKIQAELEAFAGVAAEWFQKATFVRKNHEFFKKFFQREYLEKLEWPQIQELGEHLHCFSRNRMARSRAFGRPNHDIEHYRRSFAYLAHGTDDVLERIRRIYEDKQYRLLAVGMSAISEIVGYLFPDEFMFYNRRDKFGADYLGITLPSSGSDNNVARMKAFHDATRPLAEAYKQIVTPQTGLPINLELDQFFSWLYENHSEEESREDTVEPSTENAPAYWLYAPGEHARYWDECLKLGIMSLGWDELGDFNAYTDDTDMLEKMKVLWPGEKEPTNNAQTCWNFRAGIQPGDIIFVKQGRDTLLGVGEVTGDYNFAHTRQNHRHIRTVKWSPPVEKQLPGDAKKLPLKTLTLVKNPQRIELFLKLVSTDKTPVPLPPAPVKLATYTLLDAMKDLFMEQDTLEKIINRLERKKCLILQGPPGVGKTFVARRIAYTLMLEKDDSRIKMVQFHPNYSYEDFVQGYRPDGDGKFVRKNGIFHEFATKARNDPDRSYVFIIDEINRGNLAKIFGELLMLIEADKRSPDHAVPLSYHDLKKDLTDFYIPANLYIIGTMNTADRSLERLDYALRRRFAFQELKPAFDSATFETCLHDRGVSKELIAKIRDRLKNLNHAITEERVLGRGFQVGHSYFCLPETMATEAEDTDEEISATDASEPEADWDWYTEIVDGEIRPLLEEYFEDSEVVQIHIDSLKR